MIRIVLVRQLRKLRFQVGVAVFVETVFIRPYLRIATARSGNVIGGGDWASDRILPDAIRSLVRGESIRVRNQLLDHGSTCSNRSRDTCVWLKF